MTINTSVKKTPLYDRHSALGALRANIVDFHGWLLPMHYKGIVPEHLAVRSKAGIFDVSHMGEIEITGKDAYRFIQYLITNNLDKVLPGKALYSPMCNSEGGIIDDLIVYLFSRQKLVLVVNASNKDKDFSWITARKTGYDVDIQDISDQTALIALQGPESRDILARCLGCDISDIKKFCFRELLFEGERIVVSGTGYTGEDGFEVFSGVEQAPVLWDRLIELGAEPAGLGSRDTLRLEKGYTLYGNDIDENTNPIEAGLSWTVDLDKPDFMGKPALLDFRPARRLVKLEMKDSGIPRQGCAILCDGEKIGIVTSGSFSPSLKKGIAMGYVSTDINCDEVDIEIRGKLYKARRAK